MLTMSRRAYAFQQSPLLKKFGPGQKLPGLGPSGIPVAVPKKVGGVDTYTIVARPYSQQMHPSLNPTKLWGYADATNPILPAVNRYVGPAIVAVKGTPVRVTYKNQLSLPHPLPVDTTLNPPDGQSFTRMAPHLHGGQVPWTSDGGPWSWFDRDGSHGPDYVSNVYDYPNNQSARLMWYHDHAYGITRLNAYAGIAAPYVITDAFETSLTNLIPGPLSATYLVLQEKSFQANGQLWYPSVYESANLADFLTPGKTGRWDKGPGTPPTPSVVPEFFGDTALVNGMAYPYVEVPPQLLRFRMLNGCQARVLNLQLYKRDGSADGMTLVNSSIPDPAFPVGSGQMLKVPGPGNPPGPAMIQIGTEGGFLRAPAVLNNQTIGFDALGSANQYTLLMGSGERTDVLIDFSNHPGETFILYNDAPAPFPGGDPRNDYFFGDIDLSPFGGAPPTTPGFGPNTRTFMEIRVAAGPVVHPPADLVAQLTARLALNPEYLGLNVLDPSDLTPLPKTLNEDFDIYGRLIQRLGTTVFDSAAGNYGMNLGDAPTEVVEQGETQIWDLYNFTADTHPIHFHLVDVQIIGRQALFAGPAPDLTGVAITDFALTGAMRGPDANENGWKETVRMNPGEVTRVIMKFNAPTPPAFSHRLATAPYNLANAAEYVWHCHILEHEEHDMMRPLVVLLPPPDLH